MPHMVTIELDPKWTPPKDASTTDKAQFEEAKRIGPKKVSWVAAVEAVKLSKGMYRIKQEGGPALPSAPALSELPSDELKRMFISMGGQVPTGKQMKRADLIAWIDKKTAEFEILDDDGDE